MTNRRVGFHGEDEALFVELVLRSEGLDVARVDRVQQLADFDVALLDVPATVDAVRQARAVPPGPSIVLLTHHGWGVPGATVVRRPCSVRTLVDVLSGTTTDDGDVVITLEERAVPAPPLFTATDPGPPVPPTPSDGRRARRRRRTDGR